MLRKLALAALCACLSCAPAARYHDFGTDDPASPLAEESARPPRTSTLTPESVPATLRRAAPETQAQPPPAGHGHAGHGGMHGERQDTRPAAPSRPSGEHEHHHDGGEGGGK